MPSKREAANVTLLAQIKATHAKSDATYGMPRIRAELADQGVLASSKRIASVVRLASIRGVSRRGGYVLTTTRDKRQRPAPIWSNAVCGYRHQPALGGRHDLRADLGRLSLPGSSHGCLQPQGGGLGVWGEYDG